MSTNHKSFSSHELDQALRNIWGFGSTTIVGWRPRERAIEVIAVPTIRLFRDGEGHPRVFDGARLFGRATFDDVARSLRAQPLEIRLPQAIEEADFDAIGKLVSRYTIPRTKRRAVWLIDIVGFSKCSPGQQASQLASLEFCFNVAGEICRQRGFSLDPARSTTGDGFYLWDRNKGGNADTDTFCLGALALTYLAALRQGTGDKTYVPQVRAAFDIGSHYNYFTLGRHDSVGGDFIVGEVTIRLARIIDHASAEQFLMGDFFEGDSVDEGSPTAGFVDRAAAALKSFLDLSILGAPLREFTLSLADQCLALEDKHGHVHRCYNAVLTAALGSGSSLCVGVDQIADEGNRSIASL